MTDQEKAKLYQSGWSKWEKFPDPDKREYINAPFGPGVYQLRNCKTNEYVLFGIGNHVAYRMTSLHPKGEGHRENQDKKDYVGNNLNNIEYRTIAFLSMQDAEEFEDYIKAMKIHIFNT